tara:strand:- start:1291 stop:3657 length:2367 start_codon:yes stop_codon:yes gene_type:complete
MCRKATIIDADLITKMHRGPHAGMFVHQMCAKTYYDKNPRSAGATGGAASKLQYNVLVGEELDLVTVFAAGGVRVCSLHKVAGGGKTNVIVAAFAALDAYAKDNGVALPSCVMLSFGKAACKEVVDRGVDKTRVKSFNALGNNQLSRALVAKLSADDLMMESKDDLLSKTRMEAKLLKNKTLLLVSTVIKSYGYAEESALVKLLRAFSSEHVAKSRSEAIGAQGQPGIDDLEALRVIADKYFLVPLLLSAWATRLTAYEKLALATEYDFGDHDNGKEMMVEFAIEITAKVLELDIATAINRTVTLNGVPLEGLYNEVTQKLERLPIIDYDDQVWLVVVLQYIVETVDRLLLDEFHDCTRVEVLLSQLLCPTGTILLVVDNCQAIYVWRGADLEAQATLALGLDKSIHHQSAAKVVSSGVNYRSTILVNRAAQVARSSVPFDTSAASAIDAITIESMSDVNGLHVSGGGTFFRYPLPIGIHTTLILARKTTHAVVFFLTLLGMKVPVALHGRIETSAALSKIVEDLKGTLDQRLGALAASHATMIPEDASEHYDFLSAVLQLAAAYRAAAPRLDTATPDAVAGFLDYIVNTFSPLPGELGAGCVLVSTIHAAKGLGAHTVYIAQPTLVPLEERVAKGGWEAREEFCVAYVAETRAEHTTIRLQTLDKVSRANVQSLFQPPVASAAIDAGSSQETEANDDEETEAEVEAGPTEAQVNRALALLELVALPASLPALNKVSRERMRHDHPDKATFNTPQQRSEQNARMAAVLEARGVLREAVVQAAAAAAMA